MPPLTYDSRHVHGRGQIPGVAAHLSLVKVGTIVKSRALRPTAKNGITCPYTYYHVLDALMDVIPGNLFRTTDFMPLLADRPLIFDAITVGRVIKDLADSMEVANGSTPIEVRRRWDGNNFFISGKPEDRQVMENALDDLRGLIEGGYARSESPLLHCSSLMTPQV